MKHEHYPDVHHDVYSRTVFGFWVYLMTDFMVFACLFATYKVLYYSTFGGPTSADLYDLPYSSIQTLFMLAAAFTSGLGGVAAHRMKKNATIILFSLTFLLGMIFLWLQFGEFFRFLSLGHSWKNSAFLSAYYTLLGTFAVHMVFALLWIPVLLIPVWGEGITFNSVKRLTCLRLFWQFLNVVWIFIYSFVYLMGVR